MVVCVHARVHQRAISLNMSAGFLEATELPKSRFYQRSASSECCFIALAAVTAVKLNMRACMGGMSNFKCALSVRENVCLCELVCVKSIKRALVSPNELHGKH